MSTPKESKKSSAKPSKPRKRKGVTIAAKMGFILPPEKAPWDSWEQKKAYDVEYMDEKFQAGKVYNNTIYLGAKLTWNGFHLTGNEHTYNASPGGFPSDGNSCAYQRVCPQGNTKRGVAMFAYWLHNVRIVKGTLSYLTKNDGRVEELSEVLKKRGFRCVSINRSIHHGHYPVYLFVHPGDDLLKQTTTRKVDLSNVDVLGNTDADVPESVVARNPARPPAADRTVPDAYALGA